MMEEAHSRQEASMMSDKVGDQVKRNLKMSDQYKGKSNKGTKAKGRKGQGNNRKTSGGFTRG